MRGFFSHTLHNFCATTRLVNGMTAGKGMTINTGFTTLTLVGQRTTILTLFAPRGGIPLGALHYVILSTFKIEENIRERRITWGWECPVVTEMVSVNILLTRFTKLFIAHVFLWRTVWNIQYCSISYTSTKAHTLQVEISHSYQFLAPYGAESTRDYDTSCDTHNRIRGYQTVCSSRFCKP